MCLSGDGPSPGNRRPRGRRGSIGVVSVHTPPGRNEEEVGAWPGQASPRVPRWAGSSPCHQHRALVRLPVTRGEAGGTKP